jgi:predicted nucleotidyltransferase
MALLAAVGVRAVTVGSYARGPSSFGDGSDVDILVLDAGGLTEREVYARIV